MHNTENLAVTDNGVGEHSKNHQYQPLAITRHSEKIESHKSTCVKQSTQVSTAVTTSSVYSSQNKGSIHATNNNNNNNNSLTNSKGVRECAGCYKRITERFLLKALDLYWHEDCLKCECCDCRLGEVGSTLYTKANLILCKRDYLRLFGTTGYCAACVKVIPAFEMVMRAKSNVYHLECFACQQCNHRFCVGDRFYLCENKILCEYDYEERLVFANMAYNPSNLAHIRRTVSNLQPAGDSGVNNKIVRSSSIGCTDNEHKTICTSNFQRPILSCLNETDDHQQQSHLNYQQRQHKQPQHCAYNQIPLSEHQHQPHQEQQKHHRDSGYGSSPDSETKIIEFQS